MNCRWVKRENKTAVECRRRKGRQVFTFNADDYLIYVDHIVENRTNESFDAGLFTQIKRDRRQPPDQEQSTLGMQAFVGAAITTLKSVTRK